MYTRVLMFATFDSPQYITRSWDLFDLFNMSELFSGTFSKDVRNVIETYSRLYVIKCVQTVL